MVATRGNAGLRGLGGTYVTVIDIHLVQQWGEEFLFNDAGKSKAGPWKQ